MKQPKIIGIGEIVWDMLPAGKQLGGAPVNFAFFAKELGAEAYAISAVGDDELGNETLERASATGVDISLIQRNALPTSRVLVTLDEKGIPQYEIVEGVAWDAIECREQELALVGDADVICWGSLAQRSETSRKSILAMVDAAPQSCIKVFDINIRQHFYSREVVEESLRRADILKLNEDELPLVAELFGKKGKESEIIEALIADFDLQQVVLTCGAAYSEVYGKEGLVSHIATPKVTVADTVGAGDSFTATFVTLLWKGHSIGEAHAKAVEVSAFVCTQNGAIAPLPHNFKL